MHIVGKYIQYLISVQPGVRNTDLTAMKSFSILFGAAALLAVVVVPTRGFMGPLKQATSTTKLSVSFFGNGGAKKGPASKGVLVVGYVPYLSPPLPPSLPPSL